MRDLQKLPTAMEMKIVAYMARGDKYDTIRATIEKEFGRKISAGVMTYIKRRNSEALATIKDAILQKEKDDALGILERSRRLIGKELKFAEENEMPVKLTDLVAVSKEMFHQARIEQGGEDDPAKLTNPKEKLKELQAMLEENDEIRLERIVFAKRDETATEAPSVVQASRGDGGEDGSGLQGEDLRHGVDPNGEKAPADPQPQTS